jgi:hypothetical protein
VTDRNGPNLLGLAISHLNRSSRLKPSERRVWSSPTLARKHGRNRQLCSPSGRYMSARRKRPTTKKGDRRRRPSHSATPRLGFERSENGTFESTRKTSPIRTEFECSNRRVRMFVFPRLVSKNKHLLNMASIRRSWSLVGQFLPQRQFERTHLCMGIRMFESSKSYVESATWKMESSQNQPYGNSPKSTFRARGFAAGSNEPLVK